MGRGCMTYKNRNRDRIEIDRSLKITIVTSLVICRDPFSLATILAISRAQLPTQYPPTPPFSPMPVCIIVIGWNQTEMSVIVGQWNFILCPDAACEAVYETETDVYCTHSLHASKHLVGRHNCISYTAAFPCTTCHPAAAAHLLLWGRKSSSRHRQATCALTVSNGGASSLRWGALSDFRQHDLTECEWSHTCCAARSLTRIGFGDDSRKNGWSIGALLTTGQLWSEITFGAVVSP